MAKSQHPNSKCKKLVLYIGGFILPSGNAAASRVSANAQALNKLGYDVVLYGVDPTLRRNQQVGPCEGEYFTYYARPYPQSLSAWYNYLTSVGNINTLIDKELKRHPDVIIAYNFPAIAFTRLCLVKSSQRAKLYSDLTEWYWYNPWRSKMPMHHVTAKNIDSVLRMRLSTFLGDGAICISTFLQDHFSRGIRTIFVPPLVDKRNAKWNHSKVTANPVRQFVIFGIQDTTKELIRPALQALTTLPNTTEFHLTIIGMSSKDLLQLHPSLEEGITRHDGKLSFRPKMNHEECIALLTQSDFMLLHRVKTRLTQAGFSTKLVESITAGCPVLTNNTGDIANYIIDGSNGILFDETNLQQKIQVALRLTNAELAEMKHECLNSEMFNFNTFVRDFDTLLS